MPSRATIRAQRRAAERGEVVSGGTDLEPLPMAPVTTVPASESAGTSNDMQQLLREGDGLSELNRPSSTPLLLAQESEEANGSRRERRRSRRQDAARARRNMATIIGMVCSSMTNGVMAFVYTVQLIAILCILPMGWDYECNRPLKWWLLLYALRLVPMAPISIYRTIFNKPASERSVREHMVYDTMQLVVRLLDLFYFAWFIIGNIWVYSANECLHTAPHVYGLSLAYVIIGYVFMLIPCLACGCIICCLPCIIYMIAYVAENTPSLSGNSGATQDIIQEHCGTTTYAAGDDKIQDECVICLVDFEEGENIRKLPCNHTFHLPCVDRWLKINKSCPLCKLDIDSVPGRNGEDGDDEV